MSGPQNIYPEQRHAGKIGYGPNFNAGASVTDNIHGLAYEVWGKVTHNPDKIRKGHEIFTGELKRKKLLGEDDSDPVFNQGTGGSAKASKASADHDKTL